MQDTTVWDAPEEAPILVLGSGQRCGSTLVQRLLTSHDGVLIWGEHGGHLRKLLQMNYVLEQWDANEAEKGRKQFAEGGYDSWIANLLPGADPIDDAGRAYFQAWLGAPAAAEGRPRWGFKEVRFSSFDAYAMHKLFPRLVTVHLTRDPRDLLVSLEYWERGIRKGPWTRDDTAAAIELWAGISRTFLDAGPEPWILSRRYEDVVADPPNFIREVAELMGTTPERFDAAVFEKKLHGGSPDRQLKTFDSLPRGMKALLKSDMVQSVAAELGYF